MTRRRVFDPETVTGDFWRQGAVRVALTRRDVGELFRRYLEAYPDCTQTQLALLTEHDRSDISNWVRGVRQPLVSDIGVLQRIADGLRLPDHARLSLGLAPLTVDATATTSRRAEHHDAVNASVAAGRLEIAVPPFTILATMPEELRHVLEGFRNHVVSELSRLPHTIVTATERAELAEPRTSRLILSGSAVRVDPNHVSLSLHLTNDQGTATDQAVLWSRSFLLDSDHLVEAYTTIPGQIADALGATLHGPPPAQRSQAGPNADTYESFLRAAHLIETNRLPDLLTATALLRHVVEATPSFADGHALYGYAIWRAYFSGWAFSDVGALAAAVTHSRRALALDPDSIWGRMTLVRLYWDLGRHEEAIAEGVRAVQAAPGGSSARLALARALNNAGMAELSLSLTDEILAIDETNLTAQKLRIWNLLMIGRFEEASKLGVKHNAAHPADSNTAWATTMALATAGDPDTAVAVAERSLQADQANAMLWLLLGYVQQDAGRAGDAQRTWQTGISQVDRMAGPDSRNFRVRAALANMLACVGRSAEAATLAAVIEAEEPLNSYLLYRTAQVHAARGKAEAAVALLDRARRGGFLSIELLAREQRMCALARLQARPDYRAVLEDLHDDVARLRTQYEPVLDVLTAV